MLRDERNKRGMVLIVSFILIIGLLLLGNVFLVIILSEKAMANKDYHNKQAFWLAEAGIGRGIKYFDERFQASPLSHAFVYVDTVALGTYNAPIQFQPNVNDNLLGSGSYRVWVVSITQPLDNPIFEREVTMNSRSTVGTITKEISVCFLLECAEAVDVFDYTYFINNWGWWYGDTIIGNGNLCANGQFDFGDYAPYANGNPTYERVVGNDLQNYINDGGVFAGRDIVNDQNVRGMGGNAANQYENQSVNTMPILSNLGLYEQLARDFNDGAGSTLSVWDGGNYVIYNGIFGDDPDGVDDIAGTADDETGHMFLEGTTGYPILISGPFVARGAVIVKGRVQGQGTIYSGDNIYIPDNLTYQNPPTARPVFNGDAAQWEQDVETWRQVNAGADALGLFARENVVMSDFTNSTWRSYVSSWLNNSLNASREDLGQDNLPNTGDEGEYNTIFEIDTYEEGSFIPAGKNVGDPISGTGEDIDGDGVYDPTICLADFDLPVALSLTAASGGWAGNKPPGITNYTTISTTYITQIDGILYTNHALAGLIGNWGTGVTFNGAMVSRVESIIYRQSLVANHDERFLEGGGSVNFPLPRTKQPVRILSWREL